MKNLRLGKLHVDLQTVEVSRGQTAELNDKIVTLLRAYHAPAPISKIADSVTVILYVS